MNPAGICLGEEFSGEDYIPYINYGSASAGDFLYFLAFLGTGSDDQHTHYLRIPVGDLIEDYIRRVYNLSDDIEINPSINTFAWRVGTLQGSQQTFETEAEALEYVDSLGNPQALYSIPNSSTRPDRRILFQASWRQEIDGVLINRNVDLRYTGDPFNLYTINDIVNFLALFFEVTTEEVLDKVVYSLSRSAPDNTPEPSYDCETYLKATVVDVDGPGDTIEIDINFTGSSIGDVTVTTIDGDPPLTSLENGVGSITISDDGNINMSNDGGSFYLNEFGHSGMYANGDVSLTAGQTAQLGVGSHSLSVVSDGFIFQRGGEMLKVSFDRIKEILGE